jgi:pimeloyl-ACP methyl ester carboxylesterase
VRDLRVAVDGATLGVSYSAAGPTALVALHGASEGTRDYSLYRHLHEVGWRVGIGVATFDRRGEGSSDGQPSVDHLEVQAEDALAIAEALGVERVGLWGFSQGAWVGPLAASRSSRIAFLVLIASTGVSPAEQMLYGVAEQVRRAGYGEDVVRRVIDLRRGFAMWVRDPAAERGATLAVDLQRATGEPWWPLAYLPAELPGTDDRQTWLAEMDFDPAPVFAATGVPTLLFYGADDSWTPVQASVDAWRAARGDAVDVVVIPEASHDLVLPDGRLAPEYDERLAKWLAARLSQ